MMLKMAEAGGFPRGSVVRTSPSSAGGAGSIPSQGANIPHASLWPKKPKHTQQKQYDNKFNKDYLKKKKEEENDCTILSMVSKKGKIGIFFIIFSLLGIETPIHTHSY